MRAISLAAAFALAACNGTGSAPQGIIGTWRLDPARSVYSGTAEARVEETFTCAGADSVTCEIHGIKANGERTAARFSVGPDGRGRVAGVAGVDRVRMWQRGGSWLALFSEGDTPLLGYLIRADADSMVIETTDPETSEPLGTRVVYTRAAP